MTKMKVAEDQATLHHVPLGDTVAQHQKKKEKPYYQYY